MGRSNHTSTGSATGSPTGSAYGGPDRRIRGFRTVRDLVDAVVLAARTGNRPLVADLVWRIIESSEVDEICRTLATELEESLAELWDRGWQPADLVRVVRRHLDKPAREVIEAAIISQSRTYAQWGRAVAPEWMSQLDRLGTRGPADGRSWLAPALEAVGACIEVLAFATRLPTLAQLMPSPSKWSDLARRADARPAATLDPGLLEKIRALLAKAESTEFDAEAEAFTAKAQELMTRHRIDRASLAGDEAASGDVVGRRLGIDDPYARQKFLLLSKVAAANGSRAAWSQGLGFATVFGHGEDVAGVEELYTSLLVQATSAMRRHRPLHVRGNGSATARFRRSFLIGFANRIGQRLVAAAEDTVSAVEAETGVALVPLLAARDRAAEEAMQSTLGTVGTMSVSATDGLGYFLGGKAADAADLATADGGLLPG